MSETPISPANPTQVNYPGRAALRTFVETFIPAFIAFVLILPEVLKVVEEEFGALMSPTIRAWFAGLSLAVAATAAALARIMAIRKVNDALRKVNLSARP